jgi:hypothetical protein
MTFVIRARHGDASGGQLKKALHAWSARNAHGTTSLRRPRSDVIIASSFLLNESELERPMKKMIGLLFLGGAFALAAIGGDASAQDKKKTTKNASGGVVEIVESKDGKYRFTVRDADGKYVAGSLVGHATEAEAKAVVEELKTLLTTAKFVSKKAEPSKEKGKEKAKETEQK